MLSWDCQLRARLENYGNHIYYSRIQSKYDFRDLLLKWKIELKIENEKFSEILITE